MLLLISANIDILDRSERDVRHWSSEQCHSAQRQRAVLHRERLHLAWLDLSTLFDLDLGVQVVTITRQWHDSTHVRFVSLLLLLVFANREMSSNST